ncbi:PQQ-binding-like beta-propeller repeat protein [Plantactinospora sp. S1510]|uniref:PQQ-binding-like beta-propeller repeat protein n=1 Tax=Plantactinospora alkalitolerans TaxID=2789879 RepID=A0ABS0H0M9_9ACTN|nr:PQQ-binding-like beta-propeller repeat protein [Plantactinospora alkalitolerans]MBF9132018.1 PQQ-binding-like beta-propeller repeat protein [Plantactinospora alkalitolerans]
MDRTVAVIDLGSDRYDPMTESDPPPESRRRQLRALALVLVGALVLSAGGGTRPPSPRLEPGLTVSLRVGTRFHLTEDRLFVTDPTPGTTRRVAAYEVKGGRQLWTSSYQTVQRQLGLTLAGELLLIKDGDRRDGPIGTTALDAGTGRWRWSVPFPLEVLPGERTALVIEDLFPPGSLIDAENPPPGTTVMHMSSTGGVYNRPSIGSIARAVDLASGRELWATPPLVKVVAIPAAGGRPAAVLAWPPGGGMEVWDLRSGAVLQRFDWTGGVPRNGARIGGVVMVWHSTGVTAYSADLLQPRWSRPLAEGTDPHLDVCGPLLCLRDTTGVQVLDPATGAVAWRTTERVYLSSSGIHLVETDDHPRLHRLVEPDTGHTLVDLSPWTETARLDGGSPLLLLRRDSAAVRTWLDIIDPGDTAVRPLESVPYALSSCQVVPGVIACRTQLGETRTWRYR